MGDNYDSLYPGDNGETDGAVALIASLAKSSAGCSVLEFGIGTGRLALPLHAMGVHVTGVDSSERMVAQLRHQPRGDEIDVVLAWRLTCRVVSDRCR